MSGHERGAPGLLLQMLAWIDVRPRTYGECMEGWRTSCPRLPVWEDALAEQYVGIDAGSGSRQADLLVTLTHRGRAHLAATPASAVGA